MGMSTYVQGFKPPNDEFKRMRAVWDACEHAGVPVPEEVVSFFNYESPDDSGVEVDLSSICHEYADEARSGLQVSVADIPPGVSIIRFVNSW